MEVTESYDWLVRHTRGSHRFVDANPHIPSHPSDFACVDLVNSSFEDHLGSGAITDRLPSRQWQLWFLERHSLQPEERSSPPIGELVTLRRDLRRILGKWSTGAQLTARDVRALDSRTRTASTRQRVVRTGAGVALRPEPVRRDWCWVTATIVESAVLLMAAGDPNRFKTCSNPDCTWMFYDDTVNRSKRYCSTTPCGSLMRVRRFRAHNR
jgi:predicted RNA-binding Zn ribbon-like protein